MPEEIKLPLSGKIDIKSPELVQVDIQSPETVHIQLSEDHKTLWIHIDGVCRLRINNLKGLSMGRNKANKPTGV